MPPAHTVAQSPQWFASEDRLAHVEAPQSVGALAEQLATHW
jgi:hypothetical protein